ncbi:hypothetical protein LTR70_009337 [Exophiala xenobiotica]|uniref:Transmembrane protein 53 n=1 Tax=Lithohypha guttulata TaxID=1690604 RepID=A0ABR0K0C9_9EURO|nr:hypothetical protein LTR24_008347 [Lithohypha guttulata]KAK5310652.1 hypothetical protein LTR70_009337 [Exophiala xenobiotica]
MCTVLSNTIADHGQRDYDYYAQHPDYPGLSKDDDSAADASSQNPTLIIICSWAFAQPKHIAKYIQPYKEIYPSASILLVQNVIANLVWKPDSWQMSFFQPAAVTIQKHLQATMNPRVLLHAFSNGGSHAAVQLSQACRETCGGMRMPVDALLLDSCPGKPRFAPTISALVQGVPSKSYFARSVGTILAYTSVGGTALLDILDIAEPASWKLYRRLNDPSDVFLLKPVSDQIPDRLVSRTYLYSETDAMIMWQDVVGHARVAKQKLAAEGISSDQAEEVVHLEGFPNTTHVNHVKDHVTQYWSAIRDTWSRVGRLRTVPS